MFRIQTYLRDVCLLYCYLNIRIDDDLKAYSGATINALGVTTSEAVHLVLEYVAQKNDYRFRLHYW